MSKSSEKKKTEEAILQKMDGFFWPIPEADGEVDINDSDSGQPQVIGHGPDVEPEPEKVKEKQERAYNDKQD
jgi:hypothetical protein